MLTGFIKYDADFLESALDRYRRQHFGRLLIAGVKIVGTVIFGFASVFLFWVGEPLKASVPLIIVAVAILSGPLDQWLVRRAMAQSPFKDDELTIEFNDEGFHARSSKQDVNLRWEVFTKVAHFRDGFLLFQGPKLFNWVPFSALKHAEVSELDALLHKHVDEHKIVEQGIAPNRCSLAPTLQSTSSGRGLKDS